MNLDEKLEDQGYLNLDEASALCGVAKSTLSRWIKNNGLSTLRIGQRLFIHRSVLAEHLGSDVAKALGI